MPIVNVGTNSRTQLIVRKLLAAEKIDPVVIPVVQTSGYAGITPVHPGKEIPTDKWFGLVSSSIGLKETQATLTSDSFEKSLTLPNLKGGNKSVEGAINMNLLKEGQEFIWEMFFGGIWTHGTTNTVTGKTAHTLYPDPEQRPGNGGVANAAEGAFLVERQIRDMNNRGHKIFCNCYVDSISLSIPQDGICKMDVNIFAEFALPSQDATVASGSVPNMVDDFYVGNRARIYIQQRDAAGVLQGSERCPDFVTGVNIDFNANLVKDGYSLNCDNRDNSVYVQKVGFGQRSVTGTIDCIFTADEDFESAVQDLNAMSLRVELEEDDYILELFMPQIKLPENYDPDVAQGDGFVRISVPFSALKHVDGNGEYECRVAITDTNADFGADWDDVSFT